MPEIILQKVEMDTILEIVQFCEDTGNESALAEGGLGTVEMVKFLTLQGFDDVVIQGIDPNNHYTHDTLGDRLALWADFLEVSGLNSEEFKTLDMKKKMIQQMVSEMVTEMMPNTLKSS